MSIESNDAPAPASYVRDSAYVEAANRQFIARLDRVTKAEAWRIAGGQWATMRHQLSPLLELQETLMGRAVKVGVWNTRDAELYRFARLASQYRAEELLPPRLQSLFIHAAMCGFSAACWGYLPEELFPQDLQDDLAVVWPL